MRRPLAALAAMLVALAGLSLLLFLRPPRAASDSGGGSVVLLHSHGRSGSTIAEALLFSTTNVFYLDEPLKYLKVERLARSGAHSPARSLARSLARSPARSRTHALARSRWRRARRAWTA